MGTCLLCEKPPASEPFYVESVQINLYSVWELNWFLANNIALAEQDVLKPALADWLENMCGYTESESLRRLLSEEGEAEEAFKTILESCRYYSETEVSEFVEKMRSFGNLSPAEKMKARGDALLEYGKISQAAKNYEAAGHVTGITEMPKEFQAGIYYSCGRAYAKLFQMKKAAECFGKAEELFPDEKTKDALLYTAYIDEGEDGFLKKAEEFGLEADAGNAMLDEINGLEVPPVPDDLKSAVRGWINDYHSKMVL